MVVLSPHSRRGGFSVFYSLEKSEKAFYFLDFSTFVFPPRRIKIKYILVRASHFTAPLFAAPTPHFNGYFNFFSSLRRAGLPQPARLHQEEKPKAETFTPSTVQKLPLPIIKAVSPAFMNLSFEWRSYLSRLGLAFRSALVSLCSRARELFRALLTKESFFPRFKLSRLKTGILSSANVLDTDIISSINALVKYFWNFF